jgi:hypothetical protein
LLARIRDFSRVRPRDLRHSNATQPLFVGIHAKVAR